MLAGKGRYHLEKSLDQFRGFELESASSCLEANRENYRHPGNRPSGPGLLRPPGCRRTGNPLV